MSIPTFTTTPNPERTNQNLCTRVTTTYAENIFATLDSPTKNTRPTLTILCFCRSDKETYVRIVLTRCTGILLSFINMAAAEPPRATFSALCGDPAQAVGASKPRLHCFVSVPWSGHCCSCCHHCHRMPCWISHGSPVVLAFVTASDCDSIFVAHSLSFLYPADFTDLCALDGLLMGLVGDDPTVAFPVVLPQTFMSLTAVTAVHDLAILQGVGGHGVVPPVMWARTTSKLTEP
jgi:hypothetical protein